MMMEKIQELGIQTTDLLTRIRERMMEEVQVYLIQIRDYQTISREIIMEEVQVKEAIERERRDLGGIHHWRFEGKRKDEDSFERELKFLRGIQTGNLERERKNEDSNEREPGDLTEIQRRLWDRKRKDEVARKVRKVMDLGGIIWEGERKPFEPFNDQEKDSIEREPKNLRRIQHLSVGTVVYISSFDLGHKEYFVKNEERKVEDSIERELKYLYGVPYGHLDRHRKDEESLEIFVSIGKQEHFLNISNMGLEISTGHRVNNTMKWTDFQCFLEEDNTLHVKESLSDNSGGTKIEKLKAKSKELDKEMNEKLQQCILRVNGMRRGKPMQKRQVATI